MKLEGYVYLHGYSESCLIVLQLVLHSGLLALIHSCTRSFALSLCKFSMTYFWYRVSEFS